jgi:hypothetical protein
VSVLKEPPEVVGDLDPDREVIRSASELAIHLPERGDTCLVVRLGDSGRRCQAGTQFDDAPLCRDCAIGDALATDDS